jgi:NADH:ubiquinone oxidoreductase subunit K
MGYGASLMFAWTLLLLWAYQRPLERRFAAVLTLFVIAGLAATEIAVVVSGHVTLVRMVPSLAIQATLAYLFTTAYTATTKTGPT